MNYLEAFEMWVYRRILKIPWTARFCNEEVLQRVNRDGELLITVKIRKTEYLGHLLRNQKYYIPHLIIKGKINGKRGLGREKLLWLRNIRNWTGLGFEELIRRAKDRDEYTIVIANLHYWIRHQKKKISTKIKLRFASSYFLIGGIYKE